MTNPNPLLLRRFTVACAIAVVLSVLSASALTTIFGREAWPELLLGCAAAVLNGVAHSWISARAVGSRAGLFLRWGIVMNALRVAVVLASLTAVCFMSRLRLAPLALSLVAGTVVFLACNAVAMATAIDDGKDT